MHCSTSIRSLTTHIVVCAGCNLASTAAHLALTRVIDKHHQDGVRRRAGKPIINHAHWQVSEYIYHVDEVIGSYKGADQRLPIFFSDCDVVSWTASVVVVSRDIHCVVHRAL